MMRNDALWKKASYLATEASLVYVARLISSGFIKDQRSVKFTIDDTETLLCGSKKLIVLYISIE